VTLPRLARRASLLALAVALASCAASTLPRPPLAESPAAAARTRAYDDVTSRALRAVALGDAPRLSQLASEAESLELIDEESASRTHDDRGPAPRISPRIRLLAALSAPALPTIDEASDALDDGARRGARDAESVLATLQHIEVRSRLSEAEKNNLYDGIQRPFNAVFNAIGRLFQGGLFGIVELLADGIDQIVSTQHPDPVKREVLRARRDLGAQVSVLPTAEQTAAMERAAAATLDRLRLSALQSLRNAEIQEKAGNFEAALWWLERARRAIPDDTTPMSELRRVSSRLDQLEYRRQQSLAPQSREGEVLDPGDRARYGDLLRASLLGVAPDELAAVRAKCLERPGLRPLAGSIQATEVAALLAQGRRDSALVLADWLALRGGGDTEAPAIQRLGAWISSPAHSPDAALAAARLSARKDWWNYFVFATPQNLTGASESAEASRAASIAWLQYVRLAFLPDMLSRLIALPIVGWPVGEGEIADAVARFEPFDPSDTGANERRIARAEALTHDARHAAAATQYRALTPPNEVEAADADLRAARVALRRFESIQSPALRTDGLRALYRAYGRTEAAPDIQKALARAEEETDIFLRIPRAELLAIPGVTAPDALDIPPAALGGGEANSIAVPRIPDEGVQLRTGYRVTWRADDDAPLTENTRTPDAWRKALILLGPSRRDARLLEEASKPGRLLYVPLQIEATALPGAEAAPGLVPLRPASRPQLYE
jgi:hypothetical protein